MQKGTNTMTENKYRCVITGLGMLCAIGNNVEESWNNAINGVGGIRNTETVDTTDCYATLAAEVHDDTLEQCSPRSGEMDRVAQLCVKAAGEALTDADYAVSENERGRVSVVIGSCVGGAASVERYCRDGEQPDDALKMPISAIANQVAREFGAGGIITNIGNACAAGTMSVAYACDLIRAGKCDVAIAGGADIFSSVPYAGFLSLHALAANGCSPFNHCDGITLGEGAGVLIVESYEHAKARNAKIYCEVLGSGISSDAHHITAPRPDGEGQMFAIRRALERSGLSPKDVGYINAHGTGTAKNDEAEFLSLHTIFDGENSDLNVSSTKAMVGHCLGAAGAIEAVFSVKALTENRIPPTIGYSEEDLPALKEKAGEIDFTPNTAKEKELTHVMSNSFAFGGNNASILFSEEPGEVSLPETKEKVYITGLGVISPVGNGVQAYVDAYTENRAPESTSVSASVSKPDYDQYGLKMAFYRKLDNFSQLQAVSGMAAIDDAGLAVTAENAQDIGIIVGTAAGPLATICNFQKALLEDGNAAGSAFKFPNTVYNAAGGYLSICSGIKGYNATVTNGAQSGLFSLAYGCEMIRQQKVNAIVAAGTDENAPDIETIYRKQQWLSDTVHGAYEGKNDFVLGDGSTSLILESGSSLKARGAEAYAELAGYGMANEPVPYGTLAGSGAALETAVRLACEDAGMALSDIDAIVGFGNGRSEIDDLEIGAYQALFGDGLTDLPILTVKDTVGEGRAAAAALSAGHAALLLSGKLPQTGNGYRFNGTAVEKADADLSGVKTVLVTSYGTGGSYCAVILKK